MLKKLVILMKNIQQKHRTALYKVNINQQQTFFELNHSSKYVLVHSKCTTITYNYYIKITWQKMCKNIMCLKFVHKMFMIYMIMLFPTKGGLDQCMH